MDNKGKLVDQYKKFEELKRKSSAIKLGSSLRCRKTQLKRSQKLVRRALKDPFVKAELEGNCHENSQDGKEETAKWVDIKPFLTVNDHLQGPVPHGSCGPKTELEYQIEDCIKEGDFEKAELLSDTLANREFAVKIARAFAAKQYKEKEDEVKMEEKRKRMKKIRGMFDTKERWQMKGNM